MDRSEDIRELAAALVAAQAALKPAVKDSENPHFRSRYADLASVSEACRGPLTAHGLAVVQTPEPLPEAMGVGLRTTLLHTSGQYISSLLPLMFQAGNMQSLGSALTLARRYGLAAMIFLVADEDDDGNLAAKVVRGSDVPAPPPRPAAPAHAPAASHGHGGIPRSGKGLFAWCKEQEQRYEVGIIKYLNNWAKDQGFPGRMVDWDADQVALAHAEAVRKLGGDDNGREPGSDDE